MKLKDIPMIYNLDKIRIYQHNTKIEEFYIETFAKTADEIKRAIKRSTWDNGVIEYLDIRIEGELSTVVVLEIYLR